jgi:hypothetical protein
MPIGWSSANAPAGSTVTISLLDGPTGTDLGIIQGSQNQNGSYSYTVPNVPAGGYKIRAKLLDPSGATLVTGDSNSFTIAQASGGTPSLTVTAPPSGQAYSVGSSIPVAWTSTNAPAGAAVATWFVDGPTNYNFGIIHDGQPASGSFPYTAPNVPTGTYYILVRLYDATGALLSSSQSPNFTISQ